ncbi:MAG: cation:proton antiporter, partial [Planctomycetota bacterium]
IVSVTIDPEGTTPLASFSKHYTPLLGLLLGAIVGGSSGLVVMPSLSAAGVKGPAGRLLEMESSITDTLCIVLTSAIIGLLVTAAPETAGAVADAAASGTDSVIQALKSVGREFGLGILFGIMGAALWVPLLHILAGRSHAYTFTLSALFLLYVMVAGFQGNAAMGILVFAIVIGNAKNIAKLMKLPVTALNLEMDLSVKAIHTQLAFMIKSFFFTYIGLKLPTDPWLLGTGAVLGLALLIVRLPAVQLGMLGAEYSPGDRTLIRVCMPRGLAAGVLAAMPLEAAVPGTEAFVEIVFAAVVTSIVVFSVGFKWATRSTPTEGDGETGEPDTNGDDPVDPAMGFNPG